MNASNRCDGWVCQQVLFGRKNYTIDHVFLSTATLYQTLLLELRSLHRFDLIQMPILVGSEEIPAYDITYR